MVTLSQRISNKIKETQGDISEDEVGSKAYRHYFYFLKPINTSEFSDNYKEILLEIYFHQSHFFPIICQLLEFERRGKKNLIIHSKRKIINQISL